MFDFLFSKSFGGFGALNTQKLYSSEMLLDFLFNKHSAEYSIYASNVIAEAERIYKAEEEKKKAAEEEANRFVLDVAIEKAYSSFSKSVNEIYNKYAYTTADAGFGLNKNWKYAFNLNGNNVFFNTKEFADSFASINGNTYYLSNPERGAEVYIGNTTPIVSIFLPQLHPYPCLAPAPLTGTIFILDWSVLKNN